MTPEEATAKCEASTKKASEEINSLKNPAVKAVAEAAEGQMKKILTDLTEKKSTSKMLEKTEHRINHRKSITWLQSIDHLVKFQEKTAESSHTDDSGHSENSANEENKHNEHENPQPELHKDAPPASKEDRPAPKKEKRKGQTVTVGKEGIKKEELENLIGNNQSEDKKSSMGSATML